MPDWSEVDGVAHAAGMLYVTTTSAQTGANTTETTLATYSLAADQLGANGQSIVIEVAAHCAANTNTKTIKLKFGSNSLTLNPVTVAPNGVPVIARVIYIRTGASAQLLYGGGQAGTADQVYTTATLTEDMSATITITVTGTNGTAAAGDIVFDALRIRYEP